MASTVVKINSDKVTFEDHSKLDSGNSNINKKEEKEVKRDTNQVTIDNLPQFKSDKFISTEENLVGQQSNRHIYIHWRLRNNQRGTFYNRPTNSAKMPNIRVFSGSSHPDLAGQICERLGKYFLFFMSKNKMYTKR